MNNTVSKAIIAGLVCLASILCLNGPVLAEIYKWKDETGKTHYTNDKSKIPRAFRKSDELEQLRGTESSPGAGSESASAGPKKETEEGVLTAEDESLINSSQSFLEKETTFVKENKDAAATPTAWRQFINAYDNLTTQRENMLSRVQASSVPVLREMASHLKSGVEAAKASPVGLRRMAVADAIDRVAGETAGNAALSKKLKDAIDASNKKKDEKMKDEKKKEVKKPDKKKKVKGKSG